MPGLTYEPDSDAWQKSSSRLEDHCSAGSARWSEEQRLGLGLKVERHPGLASQRHPDRPRGALGFLGAGVGIHQLLRSRRAQCIRAVFQRRQPGAALGLGLDDTPLRRGGGQGGIVRSATASAISFALS